MTGGIGIDPKNWVKKLDDNGEPILNNDGNPVLEQKYAVDTGTVLTIDTKEKSCSAMMSDQELVDLGPPLPHKKSSL